MIKTINKIISGIIVVGAAGAITATAASGNGINNTKIQSSNSPSYTISENLFVSSNLSSQTSLQSTLPKAINSSTNNHYINSSSATTLSSKGEVKNVTDGVNEIQEATNNGISQIHDETSKAINQIHNSKAKDISSESSVPPECSVINPENGLYVSPNNANYEKYKSELGGDAGTVPPTKSVACQAALKKIRESGKKLFGNDVSSRPEAETKYGHFG